MAFNMRGIFATLRRECGEHSITRGDFAIYDVDVAVAYPAMGR
jgi:hypothetical protein